MDGIFGGTPRFELGNRGFADLCLTTWLWYQTIYGQPNEYSLHLKPAVFFGADYEARTRYLHLGKVALYQMS